jgi:hypothetical protein
MVASYSLGSRFEVRTVAVEWCRSNAQFVDVRCGYLNKTAMLEANHTL